MFSTLYLDDNAVIGYKVSVWVPAGEPHLAVVLLVVQHVHQVTEQFSTITTDQDVRVACNTTSKFERGKLVGDCKIF